MGEVPGTMYMDLTQTVVGSMEKYFKNSLVNIFYHMHLQAIHFCFSMIAINS